MLYPTSVIYNLDHVSSPSVEQHKNSSKLYVMPIKEAAPIGYYL